MLAWETREEHFVVAIAMTSNTGKAGVVIAPDDGSVMDKLVSCHPIRVLGRCVVYVCAFVCARAGGRRLTVTTTYHPDTCGH